MNVCNAIMLSGLMSGSETWTMNDKEKQCLETSEVKFSRLVSDYRLRKKR